MFGRSEMELNYGEAKNCTQYSMVCIERSWAPHWTAAAAASPIATVATIVKPTNHLMSFSAAFIDGYRQQRERRTKAKNQKPNTHAHTRTLSLNTAETKTQNRTELPYFLDSFWFNCE